MAIVPYGLGAVNIAYKKARHGQIQLRWEGYLSQSQLNCFESSPRFKSTAFLRSTKHTFLSSTKSKIPWLRFAALFFKFELQQLLLLDPGTLILAPIAFRSATNKQLHPLVVLPSTTSLVDLGPASTKPRPNTFCFGPFGGAVPSPKHRSLARAPG